jgi:hypothetical protein
MLINSNVFHALSYTNFKVSGFILRSLIYFELILVQGEIYGSSFSVLQAHIQFSQQHLLIEAVFSLSYVFGTFVKSQVSIAA